MASLTSSTPSASRRTSFPTCSPAREGHPARRSFSTTSTRRGPSLPPPKRRITLDVMLEIDCDGHRSGLPPESDDLLRVAAALRSPRVNLLGVMTHAGSSYNCRSVDAIRAVAEQERAGAVRAAARLRDGRLSVARRQRRVYAHGVVCRKPRRRDRGTRRRVRILRPGDGGALRLHADDIALSVLTTVIGHQRDKGWTIVDAGWMAMSRDRGTSSQAVDQGYGARLRRGRPRARRLHRQRRQPGARHHFAPLRRCGAHADVPVGTLLRILPNHACATAAQHAAYHVLAADGEIERVWPRFNGW